MTRDRVGLVIVGAGSSARMEGIDKIWAPLGGHPVLWHAVVGLAPLVDQVVVVTRANQLTQAEAELTEAAPALRCVAGGATRQESVARGIAALDNVQVIAVHDAARPFATPDLLQQGVELLGKWEGAIPVMPLGDTVKRVDSNGLIIETLDRGTLRAAQTPQVFRASALRSAHEQLLESEAATDDARLLEISGYRVIAFPGSSSNFKITNPLELQLARLLVATGQVR